MGSWSEEKWVPKECSLEYMSKEQVLLCFHNMKLAFFGDSLLLNIFNQLSKMTNVSTDETKWIYGNDGHLKLSIVDGTFRWVPSGFYQQPQSLPQANLKDIDVVVH